MFVRAHTRVYVCMYVSMCMCVNCISKSKEKINARKQFFRQVNKRAQLIQQNIPSLNERQGMAQVILFRLVTRPFPSHEDS